MSIVNYGGKPNPNTRGRCDKIAAGLQKIANALANPNVQFVEADDVEFPMEGPGAADTTYFHVSLITVGEGTGPRDPASQFNVDIIVHHVVDPSDLAGGMP
jgi:hypothetical protein